MKNATKKIISFFLFPVSCFLCPAAIAQITPDTTLGASGSLVTPNQVLNGLPSDRIDGGALRGTNLFHSFQDFNISAGQGAYFTNPDGVTNILTRITGTSPSNILGTLGVLGNANLFLLNPNGIVFGPNANLSINGSFVGTTANGIGLTSGDIFSANPAQPLPTELLNVNPSALLFNQIAAQAIVNRSTGGGTGLQVPQGRSLLLVGGDVKLEGGPILAQGGRVELAGVRGEGSVGLSANGSYLGLSFPGEVRRADVSLTNGASVNVLGGGLGSIAINAQNLNMTQGSTLRAGIDSGNSAIGFVAGDIEINAPGAINLTNNSLFYNTVEVGAVGKGGNINIQAGSLSVTNGAHLATQTLGQGDAGSVNIHAASTVSFDGHSSYIPPSGAFSVVYPTAVGNSGGINITAESLAVTNGASLVASTFGQGNAGNVNINTRDTVSFDGEGRNILSTSGAYSTVGFGGVGNGSDINITTGSLFVTNGAYLSATTVGQGDAGSVNIHARNTVSFDGVGSYGYSSTASTNVESRGVGNGGDIEITTGALSLTNGALLTARTRGQGNGGNITVNANTLEAFNGGQILTTSFSSGKAGNISVNVTDSINLSGSDRTYNARLDAILAAFGEELLISGAGSASGLFANTSLASTSSGGDLRITTGQLVVRDGAQVNVSSEGTGNAGNLLVAADSIRVDSSGSLRAETRAGSQGNITLDASDIQLRRGSKITTNATNTATGGNITITTGTLVALEDSDITANAFKGRGGNILIDTQGIFRSADSDITAASELGINGVIKITDILLDQQNALVAPQSNFVSAEQVVAGSCLAQRNTEQGNFTIVGNGGLPETPLDAIVLPYELVQVQPVGSHDEQAATRLSSHYKPATPPTWKLGSAIHPAGALVVTADGRTLLVEALPSDAVANPQDLTCQLHQPQSLTATN